MTRGLRQPALVLDFAGVRVPLSNHEAAALRAAVKLAIDEAHAAFERADVSEDMRRDLSFRAAAINRVRVAVSTRRLPPGPPELTQWRLSVLDAERAEHGVSTPHHEHVPDAARERSSNR